MSRIVSRSALSASGNAERKTIICYYTKNYIKAHPKNPLNFTFF